MTMSRHRARRVRRWGRGIVSPSGTIWGVDKFEQLDPGWAIAVGAWLLHGEDDRATFGTDPQTIPISDEAKIGIVGDWGTGAFDRGASGDVISAMAALKPDVAIHLGDVYYAGLEHEERTRLIDDWPSGIPLNLTLNSNHEMYDGAHGYFEVALASEIFATQRKTSYFALENSNFVVVGLDSAYDASHEKMYMFGSLDAVQLTFLEQQVAKGKRVVVLTHHIGLKEKDGSPNDPLWSQVTSRLKSGRDLWYWGHVHAGYVHESIKGESGTGVSGRCAGHGAVPWGYASDLEKNETVTWFEQTPSPAGEPRVMNGFATLEFSGDEVTEKFFDQAGAKKWEVTS